MTTRGVAVLVALLVSATACSGPNGVGSTTDITLLGPTSMAEVLDQAATAYEQGHPGVRVHTRLAPTGELDTEIRSQAGDIDVVLTDDPSVLDGLRDRVGGRRVVAHPAHGPELVAATLSDSRHTDLAGDLLRWLTTRPARQLLAEHGYG